ncbi:PspC domain-containing protein [Anaerosporobacter sp.]|uniref:PspC domain-containing protein n=1 Tax=Anaerosporobacter sp. TaxID=1872529 RepID=UPI00286F154B|nr:PspC domain-containing protein [Anaerosporobacter sp.]
MEQKRLYRSATDKKLCGVCAGIAEYINIDPTLVRLLWVIFGCMGGSGVLAYIVAAIIMPVRYER